MAHLLREDSLGEIPGGALRSRVNATSTLFGGVVGVIESLQSGWVFCCR